MGVEPGPRVHAGATEGEHVVSLRDLLQILRRRLWIIASVALVLAGVAVALSLLQTPTYEASIRILVGQERENTENAPPVGVMDLEQLTRTMAEAIGGRPVAEAVIQQLGLQMTPQEFLGRLEAEQVPNTQFVQVTYEDPNPDTARQVADAIGDVFSEQISEVSPSASAITASVWEGAATPEEPASPHPVRNGLLGLVLGLMLGTGLALLLEYLDDSWRSPEEAEQVTGVPTFGVIPEYKTPTGQKKGGY